MYVLSCTILSTATHVSLSLIGHQIESMEDELRRLQQATSASLEEAKTSSDGQISSLR